MNNNGSKGLSTITIVIAIAFLVVALTLGYVFFNQSGLVKLGTGDGEEIDIEDLTDDHLDDAIIELNEIDFDLYNLG